MAVRPHSKYIANECEHTCAKHYVFFAKGRAKIVYLPSETDRKDVLSVHREFHSRNKLKTKNYEQQNEQRTAQRKVYMAATRRMAQAVHRARNDGGQRPTTSFWNPYP